jgi:ubiquinone/menaquinone biosynthesis C-methylase UbiE
MQTCSPGYLEITASSIAVAAVKAQAYGLLELAPGDCVVDVGCGPAIDTLEFARRVGPIGTVIGIDRDDAMVALANAAAEREGVGAVARHYVGDAQHLQLGNGIADACYCERLLQHIPYPQAHAVVAELTRVVKPGGRIVMMDTDWATLSILTTDVWLERQVVLEHARSFANPYSGRQLFALARSAGVLDPRVQCFNLQLGYESLQFLLSASLSSSVRFGRMRPADVDRWWFGLRLLKDYGVLFAHVSMVLVAGKVSS